MEEMVRSHSELAKDLQSLESLIERNLRMDERRSHDVVGIGFWGWDIVGIGFGALLHCCLLFVVVGVKSRRGETERPSHHQALEISSEKHL
ncbi:hypothetical protein YC2023_093958 [Brassica napus]